MVNAATNEWQTSDLWECATVLATTGVRLLRVEAPKCGNRATFILSDNGQCQPAADAFRLGDAFVNARELMAAVRNCKRRLYDGHE